MATLYQIGEDMQALNEMLAELGGDISEPEIEAAFDAWFAEAQSNLSAKVDSYCALIREAEATATARLAEANRMMALANADSNKAERLKKRLKGFFEVQGISKLETPRFKLNVQANGGALPLIVNPAWEADPASAPEQFHKVKIELDKAAIREAVHNFDFNSGEPVDGCTIGARGTHLRIR